MKKNNTRRTFFKSMTAGGAFLAAASKSHAKRNAFKRSSPSSNEMIEVGIITCGSYTHIQGSWGIFLNPPKEKHRGEMWPKATGMVMTMVWDPDPEVAKSFAEKFDVKVAKNYYDMVDKVDAVIFSGFHECGWWPQLTKPYLEAGLPCLINRPFALSIREAKEMIERSKKYNAPIYVPSAFETRLETTQLRRDLVRLLEDGANIVGGFSHQTTREYPAHGVHGIYGMYSILEPKVKAVNLQTDKWWEFKSAFMTWRCEQEDFNDYYVGFNMGTKSTLAWRKILTTKGTIQDDINGGGDITTRFMTHNYPNMFQFEKMIETGEMPQTHDYIMGKTIAFLTGFYSHCEKNGLMVNCADLPEDWRAPEVHPDRISDEIFK